MLKLWHFVFKPTRWPLRVIYFGLLFLCLDFAYPLPKEKPYSRVVKTSDGTILMTTLAADDRWRLRTTSNDVPPEFIKALLSKEDKYFFLHPGVNIFAIARAIGTNILQRKRVSGASTITMQVARLIEPKSRTYANKVAEIFRAFQLEFHHSKEEILGYYLSYLPYGGNVEGIRAASLIYFQRPPDKLSLAQSILLTIIPNRPNSLRMDRHPAAAKEARDRLIAKFRQDQVFSIEELDIALMEPVFAKRIAPETKAPHFARQVALKHPEIEIQSSLDIEIQAAVERLLSNHVRRVQNKGVSNGAVLVLDNADNSVLAYCGSADFDNVENQGQVDGIKAIRSPGSALKPAIYAIAFDHGIITPQYILNDVPKDFGGYTPENYDMKFRGPVSIEYALRNSLNIPAVSCLQMVGVDPFIDVLERGGIPVTSRHREELGLSMALGGCGVSLEELTGVFATFANRGLHRPVTYIKSKEAGKAPEKLFSESSAFLIADILSGIDRPDIPNSLLLSTNKTQIAWKTGTSYGRRDAWAIGFNTRYTIGVWMGNFDGRGVPDLSGSTMAVPLLFDIFNAIDPGPTANWFGEPPILRKREVCAETGLLPKESCKQRRTDWYIHKLSHQRVCSLDRRLFLSLDSTIQYCTACLPDKAYMKTTYPMFDPTLMAWMEEEGIQYPKPPLHNPECTVIRSGDGPKILSPSKDYDYLIEKGSEQEILLHAISPSDVITQYWYINGKFIKAGNPGERLFFRPTGGEMKVICMDDKGRTSKVLIEVEEY